MDLHYSNKKPDWYFTEPTDRNTWQRIAQATHGFVTPGNILSLSGLILVLFGAIRVSGDSAFIGLLTIAIGRILDLADGYIANKTGTKSRLGEAVDSTADKIASVIVFALFAIVGIMAFWQILLLFLLQLINAVSTLGAKKQSVPIQTSKIGKYATLLQWVTIGLYAGAFLTTKNSLPHDWLNIIAHLFFAMSLYTGVRASIGYARTATRRNHKN
jgi:phosphatidylglycerophosphate synthase